MACCSCRKVLICLFKLSVVVAISAALIHYWMQNKSFTFSDEIVKQIALKHYGKLPCISSLLSKLKVKVGQLKVDQIFNIT